jgi:enamine deaminase RidA (YjgF/YER057c/UK114 family)
MSKAPFSILSGCMLLVSCATPSAKELPRMNETLISSIPGLSTPPGYSYVAMPTGQLVFLAGQVALDQSGAVVGKGDFPAQVRQAFANVKTALAAAGCTPADVFKVNYYVADLRPERLVAIRSVRNDFFPDPKPVSTLVGVAALFHPDLLLEIEVVATKKN